MSNATITFNNEGCEDFAVSTQAHIPSDDELAWKGYTLPAGIPQQFVPKWLRQEFCRRYEANHSSASFNANASMASPMSENSQLDAFAGSK